MVDDEDVAADWQHGGAQAGNGTSGDGRPDRDAHDGHGAHDMSGPDGADPLGPDDPFDRALEAAIAELPPEYRSQLATVAIVVADEPTPEELAELGVAGLYGLYRGIPRTTLSADAIPVPSVITLYRGPLERANRAPAGLVAAVGATLRHEVAHHLGISDRRLHELQGG